MRLFVAGIRKLVRRPATFVTFGLLVGLLALIYIAVGATARQAPTRQRRAAGPAARDVPRRLHAAPVVHPRARRPVRDDLRRGDRRAPSGRGARSRRRSRGARAGAATSCCRFAAIARHGRDRPRRRVRDRDRRRDRRGRARRRPDDRPRRRGRRSDRCPSCSPAAGWRSARRRRSGSRSRPWPAASWPGSASGSRVYFGEQFATIFLPDIVKYLPFNAANAVVATSGSFGGGGGGGGATVAGWTRTRRWSSSPPG